jgi:exosortase/archaeosortase family protein
VFNPIAEIKKTWIEIPAEVQQFLKRALIIFIVWKLLYTFILFPINIPDKQLRNATSWGTVLLLKWKFQADDFQIKYINRVDPVNSYLLAFDDIIKNNRKILGIADPCNGLELYILYIGFLFCFKPKLLKLLGFLIIGFTIIYVANILRCYFIALMNMQRFNLIDVAHHYVFKLIMYVIIFGLWMLFLRNNKQSFELVKTQ